MSMSKTSQIAGAILISKSGSFLLQRRDNNPAISSPDMISIFGGHVEGSETGLQCARREIEEETGLNSADLEFRFLVGVENTYPTGSTVIGSFFVVEDVEKSRMKITEGSLIEIEPGDLHRFQNEMVPTTCFALSLYMQGRQDW